MVDVSYNVFTEKLKRSNIISRILIDHFERAIKKRIQYGIGKRGSKFFLIKEYDVVIDTMSNKIGIIVHITDGDVKKGIKKQYLFEPDDHSFVPVFRYYEQLKRNE